MTQSLIHPPEKADTPGWLRPTVEKLSQLLTLPANWDSYGARPIAGHLSLAALRLLANVMHNNSPPPDVVPTSRGTIQLEWHREGVDLEVEVLSPGRFRVYFESSMDSWERETTGDVSFIATIVEQFGESS